MFLLTSLLLLPAVLHQSLGQADLRGDASPEVQKEIVDKHNEFRRGVNPTASNMLKMTWNEKMAQNAKRWADQCKLAISPRDSRSVDGIFCGENVFYASYGASWSDVIQAWYKGSSNFKYGVGAVDPKKSVAGYTQIIWYNSYEIGCSVAYCPKASYNFFYVCQYRPVGNLVNQMATPYKQGKPCGDCPDSCEDKLCTNPCKYFDHITNCKQLQQLFGCKQDLLVEKCQSTCNCKAEII